MAIVPLSLLKSRVGSFPVNSRGGCNPVRSRGGFFPVNSRGGCNPVRSRGGSFPVNSRGGCNPVRSHGGSLSCVMAIGALFLFIGHSGSIPFK